MKYLIATALLSLTACGRAWHSPSDCEGQLGGATLRRVTIPQANDSVRVTCSVTAANGAVASNVVTLRPGDAEFIGAECAVSIDDVLVYFSGYRAQQHRLPAPETAAELRSAGETVLMTCEAGQ